MQCLLLPVRSANDVRPVVLKVDVLQAATRWYLSNHTLLLVAHAHRYFGLSEEIRTCIPAAGRIKLGTGREGLEDQSYG
jgi:hypothetical protein